MKFRLSYVLIVSVIIIFILTVVGYTHPEFNLIYVVQEGDTLSEIAEEYNIPIRKILQANGLTSDSIIKLGQELFIPDKSYKDESPEFNFSMFSGDENKNIKLDVGNVYSIRVNPGHKLPDVSDIPSSKIIKYHVGVGDTLYDLARTFNTSIGVLMALNKRDSSIIRVGDIIRLPLHNLTPRQALSRTIRQEEMDLLARVIYGEARGEPFLGQVAVGAVIINRVLSNYFPDTFHQVIYQKKQFSAVADGQINLRPNRTAYRAAREALRGTDPTMGAMYYYNPRTAKDQWWFKKRRMLVTIGDHVFTK